jgi:hypothetical protein
MQKHNTIKALFFLGIFSMLILHQVLPHWHHENEVEHTHNTIEHNDTLIHHHHNSDTQSPLIGFIDLFLEMHVHSEMSNDILLTQQSNVKQLEAKKYVRINVYDNRYSITINYDEELNYRIYHPPKNYFNTYLSSLDSRGPPSLG